MRKFILGALFVGAMFSLASCSQSGNNSAGGTEQGVAGGGVLTFADSVVHNFGKVVEGETVEKSFVFTNTGSAPLVISNITSSCGCTTPEWPRQPIAPNEQSSILVRFNTAGKPGPQSKTVTISANTSPAVTELRMVGIVQSKQQ